MGGSRNEPWRSGPSVCSDGELSGSQANRNVANLTEELTSTENRIAFARQFYNDSVMAKNNAIESFPSNFIANRFGFRHGTYFEVDTTLRETPRADLR